MSNIFLSASIPYLSSKKDPSYYNTADFIAIREAVLGAATSILPEHCLVWGGHPSVTILIRLVYQGITGIEDDTILSSLSYGHAKLYQSEWFTGVTPIENHAFGQLITTPKGNDIPESLNIMRSEMLGTNDFILGLFIGGMDGVDRDEYPMFRRLHPEVPAIPLPTTGAAARNIFNEYRDYLEDVLDEELYDRIQKDHAYIDLVHDLIVFAEERRCKHDK